VLPDEPERSEGDTILTARFRHFLKVIARAYPQQKLVVVVTMATRVVHAAHIIDDGREVLIGVVKQLSVPRPYQLRRREKAPQHSRREDLVGVKPTPMCNKTPNRHIRLPGTIDLRGPLPSQCMQV
jgi:hypothetical protein